MVPVFEPELILWETPLVLDCENEKKVSPPTTSSGPERTSKQLKSEIIIAFSSAAYFHKNNLSQAVKSNYRQRELSCIANLADHSFIF